jgi:hypothetical protein
MTPDLGGRFCSFFEKKFILSLRKCNILGKKSRKYAGSDLYCRGLIHQAHLIIVYRDLIYQIQKK